MTTPAANPGGGLFGGGGGLFGAAPAAAPALGGGLLGAPAPQQPPVQPAPSMQNGMGDGEIFEQWQKQMVKAWDDKDYKLCSFKVCASPGSQHTRRLLLLHTPPPHSSSTRLLHMPPPHSSSTLLHTQWSNSPPSPSPICSFSLSPFAYARRLSPPPPPPPMAAQYIMFNDLSQAGTDGLMQPPAPDALQRARAESLASADTGLWERADAQNPNPHRFVPVQITGFSALHERHAQQLQAVRDVTATLREAEAKLRTLEDERRAAIELRLRHYSERQQILSHRVLRLSAAIERQHLLRCHSGVEPPLGASESQWISRLLELSREIDRPDAGLMRLHDVATRLARDSGADGPTGGMGGMGGGGGSGGLPSAHQLHLQNLEEWLVRQQEAVKRLIEVSQQDLRDAQIAIAEANGVRPEHVAWGA